MGSHTVSNPQGCRLYYGQLEPSPEQVDLLGPVTLQQVQFPGTSDIQNQKQREYTETVLAVMERGLILEIWEQDIYAVRLCQCKVFWSGPAVPEQGLPNPLEREERVRVFSLNHFLEGEPVRGGGPPAAPSADLQLPPRTHPVPEGRSSKAASLRDPLLLRGGLARPQTQGEEAHHGPGW